MINIVHKNIDGVWYGAAVDAEKVLATTFAQNETEALKNLLKSLPYDAPFQVDEKLSPFSERLLETIFQKKGSIFHRLGTVHRSPRMVLWPRLVVEAQEP